MRRSPFPVRTTAPVRREAHAKARRRLILLALALATQVRADWSEFRGPDADGLVAGGGLGITAATLKGRETSILCLDEALSGHLVGGGDGNPRR